MHYNSASTDNDSFSKQYSVKVPSPMPNSMNIASKIQSLSQSLSHPTFQRHGNFQEPLLSPCHENDPPPPPLNTGTALRDGMPECLTPTVTGCNQSSRILTEQAKLELTKPPSARVSSSKKKKKNKHDKYNYPRSRAASQIPQQKMFTLSEYQPITDRMEHRPFSSMAFNSYQNQASDCSIGGLSRIPAITTSRTAKADQAIEAKQQELKDINKLRIDTLQHIIEEKMRIIEDMQQKLRSNSFAYLNCHDQHQNWRELQQVTNQNQNLRSQNNQLKFQNQRIIEQKQQAIDRVQQLVRRNCMIQNDKREIEKELYRKLNQQKQHFQDQLRQKTERTQNQFKYYQKQLHKFEKIAKNDMAMKEELLLYRTKLEQAQYQLDRSNSEQQEILSLLNRLKQQNTSLKNRMQIMQHHSQQQQFQIQEKNKHIVTTENALQDTKSLQLSESLKQKDQLESCLREKNLLQQKIIGQHAALNQCQRELSYLKPQFQSIQIRNERLQEESRQLKNQNQDSKNRFQELLDQMRNIERRFHNEEKEHVIASLRVKQLQEELNFVKKNLDTKIRQAQSVKSSLEIFKQRQMQRKQEINVVFERDQLKKVNECLERDIALIRGEMMAVREENRIKQTKVDMAPTKQDKMKLEEQNSRLKIQMNGHILEKNKLMDSKRVLQREFRDLQNSYIQFQERSQSQSLNEQQLQFSGKKYLSQKNQIIINSSWLQQSLKSEKQNYCIPPQSASVNQFQLSNALQETMASKQKISQLQDHVKQLTSQLKKWVNFQSRTKAVAGLKSHVNSLSKSAKNIKKKNANMISPTKLQYPFRDSSPSQVDDSSRPVQESKASPQPLTLKQKIDQISNKSIDKESKLAGKIDAIKLSLN